MDEFGLTYVIGVQDPYWSGYVSYDNELCQSVDMAITFDTSDEATEYMNKIQTEWKTKLFIQGV